eukprot:6490373-Amphidinium_carterae.3
MNHDYSIITTNTNLDDDYAVKMTIEIFQNSQKKSDPMNPPTQNRFFVFLLQHYREVARTISKHFQQGRSISRRLQPRGGVL